MTDDPNHHRHRKHEGEGNQNGNGRGNGGDGGDHPGKGWGSNRRITGIDLTTQSDSDTAVSASQTRAKTTQQEGEPTIKGVSTPALVAVGFALGEMPVSIPSKPGKVSDNTTTVNTTATGNDTGIKATGSAVGNAQLGTKSMDSPDPKMAIGATLGTVTEFQGGKQIKSEGDSNYTTNDVQKKGPKSEDTKGGDKGSDKDKGGVIHEEHPRGHKELTPEAPPKKEEGGAKKDKPETQNTDGKSGHKQDNKNENKDDHKNDGKKDEHKDDRKDGKGDKDNKGDHKDPKDKDGQKSDEKKDPKDKRDEKSNKNDGDKDKDNKRDNDRATNEKAKENDRDRNRDKDNDRDDKRGRDADRERILRGLREESDRKLDGKLRDDREGKRGERDHDDKGRRLEDDRTRRHDDEKLTAARLHQILRDVEDRIAKPGDRRVFGRDPKDVEGRDPRGHEGKDHRGADGKEHRGDGKAGDRSGRSNDHSHHDGRAENERRVTLAMAIRELLDILRRGSENTRQHNPQNETERPNRPEIPVNRPPERPERPEWPAGRDNNGQRPENTRPNDMRDQNRNEQFVRSPEHAAALAAMQQMMLQQQKQMEMDGRTAQPGELTPAQMAAILNGLNNEQLQSLLEELAREKDKEGRNRRPQAQQPVLEEGEKRPIKKQQTDGQEVPQQQKGTEKKAEKKEDEEELLEENDQGARGTQFVLINGVLIPVQPTPPAQSGSTGGGGSADPMNSNGVAAVFIDPNSVLPGLNLDFGEDPQAAPAPEDRRDADPSYIAAEQTQPAQQPVPRLNLQPQSPSPTTNFTTTTQPSVANVQHTEITVTDIQKFLNHLLGTDTGAPGSDSMFDHETDFRDEHEHDPNSAQSAHGKSMRDLLGQRSTNPDIALATLLNDAKKSRNYVMDQLIATMEGRKQHLVKEGESLEDIARKTFEDERVAELIYKMNSKHIPAKLIAGWKVRVRLVPNMKLIMPLQPEVEKYLEQLNKAKAPARKKYEYEPARTTTLRK